MVPGFIDPRLELSDFAVFRLDANVLQIAEFGAGISDVFLEFPKILELRISAKCFESVIAKMPGFAGAFARQVLIEGFASKARYGGTQRLKSCERIETE